MARAIKGTPENRHKSITKTKVDNGFLVSSFSDREEKILITKTKVDNGFLVSSFSDREEKILITKVDTTDWIVSKMLGD